MRIIITKRLLDKYPNVEFIGLSVRNLANEKHNILLDKERQKLEKDIRKKIKKSTKIKLVKLYNKFFEHFGQRAPIEYQVDSIVKGKTIPAVSEAVDALFMEEMKDFVLLSGHDLAALKEELIFDISNDSEKYIRINNKEQETKADDIVLKQDGNIITSLLYGPDCSTKITDKTKAVLYLFWFNEKIPEKELIAIIKNFKMFLKIISNKNTTVETIEVQKDSSPSSIEIIDPWGSGLVDDYNEIIQKFGLETFDIKDFPQPNRLMRRGAVFAGRDLKLIAKCIKEKKKFYALTGLMPTDDRIHFGNKMVVENLRYFQDHGGITYILVADLEAAAARGVTLEDARRRAFDFQIPAYIALGLDPKKTVFYFQSENMDVVHLGFEVAQKVTFNEFKAIYGSTDPGRIMSAVTQVGDILFPQLKERMPGIIPVGIDQDPHMRLTRDIVRRVKSKYNFFAPSSIYNKYTPSLDGALKMSKSKPESCISLPEDSKVVCKKLMGAKTGGRDTVDEQRKKGGEPEKCIIFELFKQHLIEDDKELDKIYKNCKAGKILCGDDKKKACELMTKFMDDFVKKVEKNRKLVDKLNFIKFK